MYAVEAEEMAKDPVRYSDSELSARAVLLAGLILGMAADWLLWDRDLPGPGLSLWLLLTAIAVQVLNHKSDLRWQLTLAGWCGVVFLASLMLILRDSAVLLPLMLLVMVSALAMTMLQARQRGLPDIRVDELVTTLALAFPRIALNTIALLSRVSFRKSLPGARIRGIGRGLLLALPLLFIFVILFASADAAFNRYATGLGDLLSLTLPQHLLIIALLSGLSAGFLMASFAAPAAGQPQMIAPHWRLGQEETATVMGSLALLFLLFVTLQAGYFFGGRETIEASSGLTLAEYARRGFFELIVVAGLTQILLLTLINRSVQRLFRPLALVLVSCVLIILASAALRLHLYMDAFGLTLSRVVAAAFMLWLGFNQVILGVALLRQREAGLIAGMVLSGIITVLLLAIANPAALVARVNLDRTIQNKADFDIPYLVALGADAVPVVLSRFDELPAPLQCQLASYLQSRWSPSAGASRDSQDWRDWNASRAKAIRAVMADGRRLQATGSGPGIGTGCLAME